jgi:hypothetical protein
MRPVNDWAVIDPLRMFSRTSSANGVPEYRARVSSPRASGRMSTGVAIGIDPRSEGVPWIVMPWLYMTLTLPNPARDRPMSARTLLNAAGSISSM